MYNFGFSYQMPSVRFWPKIATHPRYLRVSLGHLAAPGVSILKVSFLVSNGMDSSSPYRP